MVFPQEPVPVKRKAAKNGAAPKKAKKAKVPEPVGKL